VTGRQWHCFYIAPIRLESFLEALRFQCRDSDTKIEMVKEVGEFMMVLTSGNADPFTINQLKDKESRYKYA